MGVDHMRKWAKLISTLRIMPTYVAKFIFENTCCRFGTTLEIIIDRMTIFWGALLQKLKTRLGIKHIHYRAYYP